MPLAKKGHKKNKQIKRKGCVLTLSCGSCWRSRPTRSRSFCCWPRTRQIFPPPVSSNTWPRTMRGQVGAALLSETKKGRQTESSWFSFISIVQNRFSTSRKKKKKKELPFKAVTTDIHQKIKSNQCRCLLPSIGCAANSVGLSSWHLTWPQHSLQILTFHTLIANASLVLVQ